MLKRESKKRKEVDYTSAIELLQSPRGTLVKPATFSRRVRTAYGGYDAARRGRTCCEETARERSRAREDRDSGEMDAEVDEGAPPVKLRKVAS